MSEPVPTPPAPDDLPVPQAEPPIDPVPGRDPATLPPDAVDGPVLGAGDPVDLPADPPATS